MQLGLGFCLAGYSTKVRVEVSLEGLGFESEKTSIRVRVLPCWLFYQG